MTHIEESRARTRNAEDVLRLINSFAVSMLAQRTLDDLLWSIVENVGRLMHFEDCVLYLRRGDLLEQCAAFGHKNPFGREIYNPITLGMGRGVVGTVARTGKPRIVEDTLECPDYVGDAIAGRSEISVPIVYRGEVIGVIDAESTRPGAFDENHLYILQSVVTIAATRIASALEEKQRMRVERELQRAKHELEERVAERTRRLARAVSRLEDEVQERRRIEAALEEERLLLALTLDTIDDGVFVTDGDRYIVLASQSALRITGFERHEVRGMRLENLYRTYLTADDEEQSLIELPEPGISPGPKTKVLRNRYGDERVIVEEVTPLHQVGMVVVFRDVTLERALVREAEKSQRMESLGLLAGGIAHDFNNVLTGVLGRVNLAQLSKDEATRLAALDEAEKGCLTARGLTKELLAFAKGGSPVKSVGLLKDLVEESVRFCLHGSSVSARIDVSDDLHLVEMDQVQITQVLNNLVLNALQAMPDGGEVVIYGRNVIDEELGPSVSLLIRDQGQGIPEAETDRIFDPYYTTKETHSGIGLATAYWIVQRHGGSLRLVESTAKGSCFQVLLPGSERKSIPSIHQEQPAPTGHKRILLMDDEQSVRRTIADMLRMLGQDVETAANGEEAVELFQRHLENGDPFDVALLDLTVRGGMGGLKTLQRLRELAPEFDAVVISGYSDDPVIANYLEYGFVQRLEKPFRLSRLEKILGQLSSR